MNRVEDMTAEEAAEEAAVAMQLAHALVNLMQEWEEEEVRVGAWVNALIWVACTLLASDCESRGEFDQNLRYLMARHQAFALRAYTPLRMSQHQH